MKEVSFAKIDKIIKATDVRKNAVVSLNAGDEVIDVEVKSFLTLKERTDMAFEIADMVFPDDGRDVSYIPSFVEYAHAFTCFKYFTNLKVDTNVERVLAFERATAMTDRVRSISGAELSQIFAEADQIIEYRKQCAAHAKSTLDALQGLIDGIGSLLDAAQDDSRVPLEDIVQALQTAKNVDEESLSQGVLEFRKAQQPQTDLAPAPVLLSKG